MNKVSLVTVASTIVKTGKWTGKLIGSNMSPCSPWYSTVEFTKESLDCNTYKDVVKALSKIKRNIEIYLHNEEGSKAVFWQ